MKKQQQVRQIIEQLIKQGTIARFTRTDFDNAIKKALWHNDKRTFDRWHDLLFTLGFLVQPEKDCFSLNLEKLEELELNVPPEQRRLTE